MSDFHKDPDYVAARRRIIREHHPDRGGSDAALIEELRKLDEQWDRKLRIRRQVHNNRPSFISPEQADQAMDTVERAVGKTMDTVSRGAGRVVGDVRRTIVERIPAEFRKGFRGSDDSDK